MASAARLALMAAALILAGLGTADGSSLAGRSQALRSSAEPKGEGRLVRQAIRQGYGDVERIERIGTLVVLRATRPTGAVMRLTLDTSSGRLLASERIGWQGTGEAHRRPAVTSRRPVGLANL